MQHTSPFWPSIATHLKRERPQAPVLYLSPSILHRTARSFIDGFAGLVTYAVKANPAPEVLSNLVAAGVTAFDVASPAEMAAVRAADAGAVLHYNNPLRSSAEVAEGIRFGVASWSVDSAAGLAKLADAPRDAEVAVRFALPIKGAAYDFGSKFGATPDEAADLLRRVVEMGFVPALSFHPGTQCNDPTAWVAYVGKAAEIAQGAGVAITRLNIGGGFAADRGQGAPDHLSVFAAVAAAVQAGFGDHPPLLVCEPGRAMVAEAGTLAAQVKELRHGGATVFLNDGIYGGLTDLRDMGLSGLVRAVTSDGSPRHGPGMARVVFGPTCDSLDRLPDGLILPDEVTAGDYVLFGGMGAYSLAMSTGFNGYGVREVVLVA